MIGLHTYLTEMDQTLSRTVASGKIDTAASKQKQAPPLSAQELDATVRRNRDLVARFIWARRKTPAETPSEFVAALIALATLTNLEILSGPLYRQWEYVSLCDLSSESERSVPVEAIANGIAVLGEKFQKMPLDSPQAIRVAAIASIEWDIGLGPLHPFYDGCGRVSRYFSALLGLWLRAPVARHQLRNDYMRSATEGRSAFVRYYVAQPTVLFDASP